MSARAWIVGDDLNTDMLAPGAYMKYDIAEIARHCLEVVEPRFASEVRPGDVVVGGRNFGAGSSREQAVGALVHLGVAAVVAVSFAGLFYRNAFNLGLPLLTCPDAGTIRPDDELGIDIAHAAVRNHTQGRVLACQEIPGHLVDLIRAGGLIPYLERRIAAAKTETP